MAVGCDGWQDEKVGFLRGEEGQSAVEWLGAIVAAAVVIGILLAAAPGIGQTITSKVGAAIAALDGGDGDASPAGGRPAQGGQSDGPRSPQAGSPQAGSEGDGEGPPQAGSEGQDQDEGNLFTGAWQGVKDVGGELWQTTKGVGRHVNVFDPSATADQWRQTAATAKDAITHPWQTTKSVATSFWDPIAESYEQGGWDAAIGRGLVSGAGAVIGGKGLTKLGKAGNATPNAPGRAPDTTKAPLGLGGLPRSGAALKTDAQHAFPDIIDNYADDATRFTIPTKGPGGGVVRQSELRQLEGGLRGEQGVFEWIVDEGQVTHRRFIPGGRITGYPNQRP